MSVPRLYHSTAVLLPDATVLTTGGGQGGDFIDHPDYEIFTPPYLCQGLTRPEISVAPAAVSYGQNFAISTPNASGIERTGRVTLVRLSSVTHSFNMNQRFLALNVTSSTSTQLNVTAPGDPNLCPPGHYMMFLIDGNGTPSQASIIAINTGGAARLPARPHSSQASIIAINTVACATPLTISQSLVSQDNCSRVTQFTVSGGNGGPYEWRVNGIAYTQSTGASIDLTTNDGEPALQVRVVQAGGCGASASLTSYFPRCYPDTPCRTCPTRQATPTNNPPSR